MPSAQKPAGAEGAERALSRDQPAAAAAAAAVPTPANNGSPKAVMRRATAQGSTTQETLCGGSAEGRSSPRA